MKALSQHMIDLINADIDGEISAGEKRELEAMLASNSEARVFHAELSELCRSMDSAEAVAPPAYLRHAIMQMTSSIRPAWKAAASPRRFLFSPALRLAGALVAGIVLGFGIFSVGNLPATQFDDLRGLVGTMSGNGAEMADGNVVNISHRDISGSAAVHRAGKLLIVDLDLVARVPVDIVTEFPGKDVWFNGFAQLESTGTSVAAEPGRVTVRAEGRRRYALYLHDAGSSKTRVHLRFLSNGALIHETALVSSESVE